MGGAKPKFARKTPEELKNEFKIPSKKSHSIP